MGHRVRLLGLVTATLFAAALSNCSGNVGTGSAGSAGTNGAAGDTGEGGATTVGRGGSTGTGGSGTGGSSGTTGRGGTGGSAVGGTGGSTSGTGGTGAGATTGRGGTGGSAGASGTGGSSTGGSSGATGRGGSGGSAAGSGGSGGSTGTGGGTGTGGSAPGTCIDGMQNGSETGVDCGGSCGACPSYKISNGPNTADTTGSGCNNGPAFMCVRDMVYSPEFKAAEADDFGSPTNPQFVYGVVGHDVDSGGIDKAGNNACCECYQLIFTTNRDNVSGVATPKPMIVQAFNTGAGGGKNFDIFMGDGGEGGNANGCPRQYTNYPSIGQTNNGGIRALTTSQCVGSMNQYSATSIGTASCQSAIASACMMITASNASVQSTTQDSCVETSQPQNLYHLNWNVLAKRIECPANLTRVTGCKLNSQGLPMADPTAVDMNSANGKGFSSGYTTTTMQDCCRPTCAYKGNVSGADSTYKQYYTCDASGNPS